MVRTLTVHNCHLLIVQVLRISSGSIPLSDLLGPERADAIEAEGEDYAMFVAQPDVKGEVLRRHHTTLPGVTGGRG